MYGSFSSIGTISFIDRDENILGIIRNEKGKAIDLNKWLVKNMKRLKIKLPPPENQELQEEVESSLEKDDSIAMLSENSIKSSTKVKDIKIQAPIGYEYIDWNTRLLTPPTTTPLDMQYSSLNEYKEIPSLTDEEILKIIASEYKTIFPPCQKTSVDAIIIDTDHNCIYIYKLETFTESRSVEWAQEPWVAYKQGSNDAFLITNNNSSSNTKINPQVSRQKNDTTSPNLILSQRRNDSMEVTATNTLIDDDGIGRLETKIIKAHSLNKSFECLKPNSSWLGAIKNKSSLDNNDKIKNLGYAKADASSLASAPPFKGVSRCETSASRSDDDRIPPDPWAINYEPGEWFTNAVKTIEIPNTANYSKCNACKSDGWKRCWRCSGRGTVSCITCNGTGKMSSAASSPSSSFTTKTPVIKKHTLTGNLTKDFCFSCSGRGRKRCQTCDVEGKLLCDVCKGYKGVKSYVKLTIKL